MGCVYIWFNKQSIGDEPATDNRFASVMWQHRAGSSLYAPFAE
ncbi:hypothetical protein EPIR_0432 [Erwinia piriflorinigrans CFBP 5888]|uniref:Uncharacterized protein n=1 Tax=Erwinia piriflorinigrans CFBP 5888 TaxID=1161919 RepID=V5Z3D4_9GAMM|nr:hypothetical protein EPIR_0432 [Erwinia piriflorinigrans CFBP 5888]